MEGRGLMSEAASRTTTPAADVALKQRMDSVPKQPATAATQLANADGLTQILDRRGMLALQRLAGNQACLSALSGLSIAPATPARRKDMDASAGSIDATTSSSPSFVSRTTVVESPPGGAAPLTDEQRFLNQVEQEIKDSQWDQAVRDLTTLPAASVAAMLTSRTLDQLTRLKEATDRQPAAVPLAAAIEPRRIAQLNTDYTAAVSTVNWPRVAVLLNAYNQPDQQTRLEALQLDQLTALKQAADQLGWPALIAIIETRRVAQLNIDYTGAVSANKWIRAAELLNAFSDSDIQARIATLLPDQRVQLLSGTRQATTIGTGDRIISRLRTAGAPVAGRIFGTVAVAQTVTDGSPGSAYTSPITITFTPNPALCKSIQISYVQTVRIVTTGTTTSRDVIAGHAGRLTASQQAVDRIPGRSSGWYGFNNDGTTAANVTSGSSPTPLANAVLRDQPSWDQPNLTWEFETSVIAKQGADAGLVYSVIHWGFSVDASLHLTALPVREDDRPTHDFEEAVAAWNRQAAGPAATRSDPNQQPLPAFR